MLPPWFPRTPLSTTSIFPPAISPEQWLRYCQLYQQHLMMLTTVNNIQNLRTFSSPDSNCECASGESSSSSEKPKFDFTHLADSIETEEKERAGKIVSTPSRAVAVAAAPYPDRPWFMVPGRARGNSRANRPKKQFICRHCERHFTKSYNLLIHERTHTDERPYQCDICLKRFRRQDHLRDHKFIHSKVKPFKCDVCGKGFCQARTLQTHRETHNREEAQTSSASSPSTVKEISPASSPDMKPVTSLSPIINQ